MKEILVAVLLSSHSDFQCISLLIVITSISLREGFLWLLELHFCLCEGMELSEKYLYPSFTTHRAPRQCFLRVGMQIFHLSAPPWDNPQSPPVKWICQLSIKTTVVYWLSYCCICIRLSSVAPAKLRWNMLEDGERHQVGSPSHSCSAECGIFFTTAQQKCQAPDL